LSKVGLVLEGGAMRGMFTAGVLDTFMENNIKIDGIVGVSAGALFGVNYFSKQKGRVIRYSKRFCRDLRYMSMLSLLFTGNVVNKNFAYYKVTKKLDKFDNDTYKMNNTGYYAVVTNVETGCPEYIKIEDCIKDLEFLRASSALPMASKIINIGNKKYLDGGISDAIPIEKCFELGYDKVIVILTRDLSYRKKSLSLKTINKVKKKFKNYPKLIDTMINRYDNYNNTIDKIIKLEKEGKLFVIRPTSEININLIERNKNKLQEVYDLGVSDCNNVIDNLKKYLKKETF